MGYAEGYAPWDIVFIPVFFQLCIHWCM